MLQARSWLPRTEGSVRIGFAQGAGRTRLRVLRQTGAARACFPRSHSGEIPEVVLLNTAGGLTGGDRMGVEVSLGANCGATVTSAAAEKIYRSLDGEAEVRVCLGLDDNAHLAWLPQPTILFDRARLDRSTEVSMAADARFLAVEILIFGRAAMGEDVLRGMCRDRWRIRRAGRLVFADALRLDGAVADVLNRSATAARARAVAMLIYVAPDAPARICEARALLAEAGISAGASAWDGLLLVRAAARDGRNLQRSLEPLVARFSGRPLPRVWRC